MIMLKIIQGGGKQMKEKNRGITLIALVITIVVMMILVGASIKLVIDSNMIDTADNAVKKYRLAENNEKNFLDNVSINGGKLEDYLPLQQINAGERATLKSLYGSVVVPAGFTVSMIPSEQNVEDGLVIYDIPEGENVNWEDVDNVQTKYNQFVYVPTGNFYVGRYEVGSEEERTADTVDLSTPLLKRDLYPYNYVTYQEAIALCKAMYPGLNIGLCSIEELQAIDEFMSNKTGLDKIAQNPYSATGTGAYRQLGNFAENGFSVNRGKIAVWNNSGNDQMPVYSPYYPETPYKVGTSGMYFEVNETRPYQKEQETKALLSTGAVEQFSVNNIFDLYGNLSEYIIINDSENIGFFRSSYELNGRRSSKQNEFG